MPLSRYNPIKLNSIEEVKYYSYGKRIILTGTLLAFICLGTTGCASIGEILISAKGLAPSAVDEIIEDPLCTEKKQYQDIIPFIVKAKEALQKVNSVSNELSDAQLEHVKNAKVLLLTAKNYAECPGFLGDGQLSIRLKDAYSPLSMITSALGPDEPIEIPLTDAIKTIDDILASHH